MKKKIILPILLPFLLLHTPSRAQQRVQRALFSQYQFNSLALNPASSASDEQGRITALTRHQWVGFDGAPQSQTLSGYAGLPNGKTSVGAMFIHDKIGVENEQALFLSLAQKVQLGPESYLAAGFSSSIGYYLGNYASLPDSPDPVFTNQNSWRAGLGLGLMYYDEHLELGISAPYLAKFDVGANNSSTSTKALRSDYYLMGSYRFAASDYIKLKPAIAMKYTAGVPMQIDVNMNAYFEDQGLWLGLGYRSASAVVAMFQVRLTERIQLGYSHDFMTSVQVPHQMGTHEVMLNYRFNLGRNPFKVNAFRF